MNRYFVDRGDVAGGREKRNITVLAHLVFANSASVPERPLPYHIVCEHYLVFANHCDRLARGFTH
jgi:hypothetical protein